MRTWSGLISFFALLAMLSLAGCKQGKGEHCQIDSDCKDGLKCVPGANDERICGGGAVDGGPGIDAATPDAAPGTPDAAAIDADTTVDAAGIDAPAFTE